MHFNYLRCQEFSNRIHALHQNWFMMWECIEWPFAMVWAHSTHANSTKWQRFNWNQKKMINFSIQICGFELNLISKRQRNIAIVEFRTFSFRSFRKSLIRLGARALCIVSTIYIHIQVPRIWAMVSLMSNPPQDICVANNFATSVFALNTYVANGLSLHGVTHFWKIKILLSWFGAFSPVKMICVRWDNSKKVHCIWVHLIFWSNGFNADTVLWSVMFDVAQSLR